MGDKNIKAVAVRGTKDVSLARGAEFMAHMKDITKYIHYRNTNPLPGVMTILSGICSPQEMKHTDEKWHTESFAWGNARKRRKDFWTKDIETSWKETQDNAIKRFVSCFNCPQQCGGLITHGDVSSYMMKCFSKLTYLMGAYVDNLDFGFRIGKRAFEYGVDSFSTPQILAFAVELYEAGILTDKDFEGCPTDKEGRFIWLLDRVVRREGIGDILADGTYWAARKIGNGSGIHGGYSSHIAVAAASLCAITHRRNIPLEHMAAVADTVATAFQAARRSSMAVGDYVIVIGAAEMGPFLVQMAKAFGAATVMVVDTVDTRLHRMLTWGADVVINAAGKTLEEVAVEVRHFRESQGLPASGWKIFTATGTRSGRNAAADLVGQAGKLILVASETATIAPGRSRLSVVDAEVIDSGRCPSDDYPRVGEMVISGRIAVSPFVQTRPMNWIREVFAAARMTPSDKHTILTADDLGLEDCPEPKSCR